MKQENPKNIYRWALGYLVPYRGQLSVFLLLTVVEIIAGLLRPWPLKFIIDNALGDHSIPAWLSETISFFGSDRVTMLILGCVAYLVINYAGEFISVAHTQVQQGIGQRLVFDLRQQMFAHLQSLSMRYHQRRGTGVTIYHIENDSYCVESLTLNGILPLASSAITLAAMLVVLLSINWQVALMSLAVVPFLLLVNRHYSDRIVNRSEQVKNLEAGVINFFHEVFSSIRVVKAFVREPHEQHCARFRPILKFKTGTARLMRGACTAELNSRMFTSIMMMIHGYSKGFL